MAIPSITETINDAFVHTWYKIRADATDNILNATPTWAALNEAGRVMGDQPGRWVTRTIKYGTKTATAFAKGDVLSSGEDEIETMARWKMRNVSAHIQRSTLDDNENSGEAMVKRLVDTKLQAARDALVQDFESSLLATEVTAETGKEPQSLLDIVPRAGTSTSNGNWIAGTYGQIARPATYSSVTAGVVSTPATGNTWWGPKYLKWQTPYEVHLLEDMAKLYNSVGSNIAPPNLLVTNQTMFEVYEQFAVDKSQIVKDATTMLADLGFDVLRFKGKPMIWQDTLTLNDILFLNTDFIDIQYNPLGWFAFRPFVPIPQQFESLAYIYCTYAVVSDQLRRHGRGYETGST